MWEEEWMYPSAMRYSPRNSHLLRYHYITCLEERTWFSSLDSCSNIPDTTGGGQEDRKITATKLGRRHGSRSFLLGGH